MSKTGFYRVALLSVNTALLFSVSPAYAKKSSALAKADRQAELDQPEFIYPKAAFDPILAKKMLQEGNVEIRGIAFHKLNGYGNELHPMGLPNPKTPLNGVVVYLYPATPHLIEWQTNYSAYFKRQKQPGPFDAFKKKQRPKVFKFDDDINNYRLAATADQYGRFAFGKMLPGRYYVTVSSQASGSYVGTEVAGRSTVYNGWGQGYNVDHTRDVERNFRTELFVEQYVDIKPGDDVVELELRLTAQ